MPYRKWDPSGGEARPLRKWVYRAGVVILAALVGVTLVDLVMVFWETGYFEWRWPWELRTVNR